MTDTQFLGLLVGGVGALFALFTSVFGFLYKYIFKPQMQTNVELSELTVELRHQNELQSVHNDNQDQKIVQISDDIYIINGKIQRLEDVVFKKDYSHE